jgi:hypothetical protein
MIPYGLKRVEVRGSSEVHLRTSPVVGVLKACIVKAYRE